MLSIIISRGISSQISDTMAKSQDDGKAINQEIFPCDSKGINNKSEEVDD